MRRVAIVGAGMAGAACARRLADHGLEVALFDKGRSVGGRLAQRRLEGLVFDHGAQYLSAREPAFMAQVERWRALGLVADWPEAISGRGDAVLVGTPAMNAPVRELLADLPVPTQAQVMAVARHDRGWELGISDGTRSGPYEVLVLAVPAPQAAGLLGRDLSSVAMAPCWSVLMAPAVDLPIAWTARRSDDAVLAWAARNDRKPGRGGGESWTLHATPGWSREHLEDRADDVAQALLDRFAALSGIATPPVRHLAAHRWRFALVERPLGHACLWEPERGLGLCGDWCLGPRVEAAFLSGMALGEAVAG